MRVMRIMSWCFAGMALPIILAGCATTNPCAEKRNGICVSSREVYGITRNRDQVNPSNQTLKAQKEAAKLINTPPEAKDELPSIHPEHPEDGAATAADESSSGPGGGNSGALLSSPHYPRPLITQPKIMRVWIAPYQGPEGNLHFPGMVYTIITPQEWAFGQNAQHAPTLTPAW